MSREETGSGTEPVDGGSCGGFEVTRREGVVRIHRDGTEWLSGGPNGGRETAPAAYNVSVPEGWPRTDLESYVADRLERAEFDAAGPALLTGVGMADARAACCGSVTAVVTAGISNPATLPMEPDGDTLPDDLEDVGGRSEGGPVGTVNVLVGTTRALSDGALHNLLSVVAEAKTATLLSATGFPGTTTDAVVVGHDPYGPRSEFSGSATRVGAATRACVRDALLASLRAHYGTDPVDTGSNSIPASLAEAEYGVSTDLTTSVFQPE